MRSNCCARSPISKPPGKPRPPSPPRQVPHHTRGRPPGAANRLADYRGWLAAQTAFDAPSLEKATLDLMTARGLGLGDIVHAVRIAITGLPVGPGLFDTVAVLGKETCLRRIDRALAKARAA